MSKYIVSFYQRYKKIPTVTNTKAFTEIAIETIFTDIKIGKYKAEIELLRSYDKAVYDAQKQFLPAFTPSGTFVNRNDKGLLNHTGIICIDFDKLKNATDIRDCLSLDNWVYAAFISPSGKGVKAFIFIDPTKHEESFEALANHYEKELGLRMDGNCRHVSRLCFISYDSELYSNQDATVYALPIVEDIAVTQTEILHQIDTITNRIEAANKDITNGYEDWLKLGFSLAATLKEAGRQYFHRISKLYLNYNYDEAENQYNECLKGRKNGVTIKTFFYLAKSNGIDIFIEASPAPRNTTIRSNANADNRGEVSERTRIENTISDDYQLRFNIILNRVECKEIDIENSEWEEANEHDISRHIEIITNRNCSPNRIKSILSSNFVSKYNPFKNYFESLPKYDKHTEPDYIENLCSIVQLKDETTDRERFNRHFKKALIRCVACSISDDKNNLNYNKHAIIFISPKQSIGKSGFIRFLIPKEFELYFTEKMTFGNREEDFTMQSSFIINLDEMAQIDEKNLASVKSAMSKGNLNFRDMNTSRRINAPRRCNFFGNTNETQILKDDTGSIRWLCFEVDGFNRDKTYWEKTSPLFVDINKVWAQAYTLFNNGFNFQLTVKEQLENEVVNNQYKENSVEEELITSCLKPAPKEKLYHKQVVEILGYLAAKNPFVSKSLNINKVGSVLKYKGFLYGQEFVREKGFQVKGYYVVEI